MFEISNIWFDINGSEFLLPYLSREMNAKAKKIETSKDLPLPAALVVITTHTSPEWQRDIAAERLESERIPICELFCPFIIGTGMNGLPMEIARRIYKGTYVKVYDNEAYISLIHAVDVARFAKEAAGLNGKCVLTDEKDHTMNVLADALAYRIDNKRLWNFKGSFAKWILGPKLYEKITRTETWPCTAREILPNFQPINTLEYLMTHNYDESSL